MHGNETTCLLGVLQHVAAHTRLAEISRPNKEVPKAAQATHDQPNNSHTPPAEIHNALTFPATTTLISPGVVFFVCMWMLVCTHRN